MTDEPVDSSVGPTAPSLLDHGIVRAAATIAVVTVAARVVGLVRTAVMAATVGDSGFVGNTYGTANTLPNIVFEVVAGGALASLVVPLLARPVATGDVERVRRITSSLLTWTVLILVPVAVMGAVLARPLMRLLTIGVADDALRAAEIDLGARMLVVFMPQVVLYGVGIVLAGVLQSHRRFLGPALAPLLSSAVVIAAYLVYADARGPGQVGTVSRTEELVLSIGTTLGVVVLSLSLLVPVARLRLRLRPLLAMPADAAAQVRRLAVAGGAGIVAQQIALVVALVVVNSQRGAVVAYQLAYTVFLLPWGVLAVPLATSSFPSLAAADTTADYGRTLSAAARTMIVLCGGATAVVWSVRGPLAELLPFQPDGARSAIDAHSAVAAGIAALVLGLVPYGLIALLTRALFARGRSAVAAAATVAGFGMVALGSAVLAGALPDNPVVAVGVAHSAGLAVAAAMLLRAVRRDSGPDSLAGLGRAAGAVVIGVAASAATGAAVVGLAAGEGTERAALACLVATAAATAVYGVVLSALGRPEPRAIVARLRGRESHG
ncbi:MAG TPA: lipid II flippase MurJ [Mycobacteriales bacterium]|nr:lipid II flippase MurJ [Mycobacteriales bacterium]